MKGKNMSKERMLAVGAFIRTIRETGKVPAISKCLKDVGYSHPSAELCRKLEACLKKLQVYGIHRDGTAFLYKENWDASELMESIESLLQTIVAPPKKRKANQVPQNKLAMFTREELLAELERRDLEENKAVVMKFLAESNLSKEVLLKVLGTL